MPTVWTSDPDQHIISLSSTNNPTRHGRRDDGSITHQIQLGQLKRLITQHKHNKTVLTTEAYLQTREQRRSHSTKKAPTGVAALHDRNYTSDQLYSVPSQKLHLRLKIESIDPTNLTMNNPTSAVWLTQLLRGAELVYFLRWWD